MKISKQPRLATRLKQHSLLLATVLLIIAALSYWLVVASNRYVSTAHVMIQSTDMVSDGGSGLSKLLRGGGASVVAEQLLLRDYLLSTDMLTKLDAKLDLRSHYSQPNHDIVSRFWFKDAEFEHFYDYYLRRVSVELDEYSGVLIVKAQAYDAKTAHAIARYLVEEGERYMNQMAHDLAQEQVDFLQHDIQHLREQLDQARHELLSFQNQHDLVSPQATTDAINSTINRMESQLTDLQTQRAAMLGYLQPNSTNIIELNLQIDALNKQMAREKAKLTSPKGKPLNATVEAYQRLELNAQFAQDLYQAALTALEQGRIQASRTLKKISLLQAPTQPQYAQEPRRLYNSIVSTLVILISAGIIYLLSAIIRDHRD